MRPLAAGNHVDVLAATSTDTSWRFKETKKSGLMGTAAGFGFTIISSISTHDREAGRSRVRVPCVPSSPLPVMSVLVSGQTGSYHWSDVIANRDPVLLATVWWRPA